MNQHTERPRRPQRFIAVALLCLGLIGSLLVLLNSLVVREQEVFPAPAVQSLSTDTTSSITPSDGSTFVFPGQLPDRDVAFSDLVAEGAVVRVFPVRTDTESGLIPTVNPALTAILQSDYPAASLYTPVQLEFSTTFKSDVGEANGILLAVYSGDNSPIALNPYWIDRESLRNLHVEEGDHVIAFFTRSGAYTSGPLHDFLIAESQRLSSEGEHYLVGYALENWYVVNGTQVGNDHNGWFPIDEFRTRITDFVSGSS